MTLRERYLLCRWCMAEQARIAGKTLRGRLAKPPQWPCGSTPPAITLFVSSLNTRAPLELMLLSLQKQTAYPVHEVWVGENASTDGSREFLEAFRCRWPVRILSAAARRPHVEWLDEVARTVTTPYWFAVDSDMLFLAPDPIADMVARFESDPDVYLVAAEHLPGGSGVEPVGKTFVDFGERPSTWLFGVRTNLRDRLNISFDFFKRPSTTDGRTFLYDVGGKLLEDMRSAKIGYAYMGDGFAKKYHHFGSLSWFHDFQEIEARRRFKKWQLSYIDRAIGRHQRDRS